MPMLTKDEIKKRIPHRATMLLIDEIVEMEEGVRGVGVKHVSDDAFFLDGHFPGQPVMPGVIIVECLAQTAAVILSEEDDLDSSSSGRIPYFGIINNFKFIRPVFPGSVLILEVEIVKSIGKMVKIDAQAKVNNKIIAHGELTFAVQKRK